MIPASAYSISDLNDNPGTCDSKDLLLFEVSSTDPSMEGPNSEDPMEALNVTENSTIIALDLLAPPTHSTPATQHSTPTFDSNRPPNYDSEVGSQPAQDHIDPISVDNFNDELIQVNESSSNELLAGIVRPRNQCRNAASFFLSKLDKKPEAKPQGSLYTVSGISQPDSYLSMFELVKLAQEGRIGPLDIVCHVEGKSERAINIPALRGHFLAQKPWLSSRVRSNLIYLAFLASCSAYVWLNISDNLMNLY